MALIARLWKSVSLKNIIIITVASIMLIQAIIIFIAFEDLDLAGKLDETDIQVISNTVSYRANTLVQDFSRFTNLSEFYSAINSEILSKSDSRYVYDYFKDDENVSSFLEDIVPIMVTSLRSVDTTSIFIILEGNSSDYKDALYIRDYNPHDNKMDYSDLFLEAGPLSIVNKYNIPMDTLWTQQLNTSNDCTFYTEVLLAANKYLDKSPLSLGYFSLPTNIHEGDVDAITYSVPLVDSHHHCFGVIGFGMTLDFFQSQLDYKELHTLDDCAYLVALLDNDTLSPIFIEDNGTYSDLISLPLAVTPDKTDYNHYLININGQKSQLSAFISDLPFSNDTIYSSNNWVLCGIIPNKHLFIASNYINNLLLIFIICTIIIAFFASFILIRFITDPVDSLLFGIKQLSPNKLTLEKTNIKEYDELASAIETQNTIITNSSLKLADILEIAQVPIGVLEYSPTTDKVFCTKSVFDILSLNATNWNNNFVDKNDITSQLTKRTECFRQSHDNPDIYLYRCPNLEDKWLRIAKIHKNNTIIVTFEDVTKEQETKEELLRERDYDVLTNLYNRRAFARVMQKLIDDGESSNGILSIWDLDNLKYANDNYGHDMGDKYICLLGKVLSESLSVKSVCARLAGDEFTLYLYGAPNDVLLETLKKIHGNLLKSKLILPNEDFIYASASAGVSCYPEDGNCYKDLLKFADYAMYQIKHSSKGMIKKFDRESYIHDYILVNGIGELDRIISEQAIKYSYQPIYSMETDSIFAYEALIRPVSDLLSSPDNLLKVAQNQSKLGQIERITWFLALRYFYEQVKPDDASKLFINSIPNQLLSEEDFNLLENEYGADLSRIVLEITESSHADGSIDSKKRSFCKKWNIPIALDDFGSGYSNSDILVTRPFNYIKIDRSLVHSIDQSPSKQVFVSGIITYCHENNQLVIAEGIETSAEYDIMKKMGADFAQGYFLKKPNCSLY